MFELGCEYKLAEVGAKTKFLYLGPGNAKMQDLNSNVLVRFRVHLT